MQFIIKYICYFFDTKAKRLTNYKDEDMTTLSNAERNKLWTARKKKAGYKLIHLMLHPALYESVRNHIKDYKINNPKLFVQ